MGLSSERRTGARQILRRIRQIKRISGGEFEVWVKRVNTDVKLCVS